MPFKKGQGAEAPEAPVPPDPFLKICFSGQKWPKNAPMNLNKYLIEGILL